MGQDRNFYRIGAQLEVGRRFWLPILLGPALLKVGAAIVGVGVLALGALWLWMEVPHVILAGLTWLTSTLAGGLAFLINRRERQVHVKLTLAATLLMAAAVAIAIKG